MTANPPSDFIRHTTDLCWLPAPHSAEHWVTSGGFNDTVQRNASEIPYIGLYLAPGAREPLDAILTEAVVADLSVGGPLAAAPLQRKAAHLVGQAEDSSRPSTHPTVSRALWRKQPMKTDLHNGFQLLMNVNGSHSELAPYCSTRCRTSSWHRFPCHSSPHRRAADSCCTRRQEQSRPRC